MTTPARRTVIRQLPRECHRSTHQKTRRHDKEYESMVGRQSGHPKQPGAPQPHVCRARSRKISIVWLLVISPRATR
jgi:hypothetical protein